MTIPVNTPLLGDRERELVLECLETSWISSDGPFVRRFEEAFAEKVGRRWGIAVSSGTAALEVAMHALELDAGDEVVLPSFSIISCAAAVTRARGRPVLVDSDALTWNMDPGEVAMSVGPRTRALLVPHTYGLPADMDPLLEIAATNGLKVIEDAAEMHGQTYRGRPCGSFGDLSVFSFYANKHVTTGEGGMVVTDDPALAERCRSLRNLCFQEGRRFVHEELGFNFRMTNLQAALGLAQLEQLDERVARKRRMGASYDRLLAGLPDVQLPLPRTGYAENIYWVYGMVLDDAHPLDAEGAMSRLAEQGVGTRPFFWPMHEQPVFRRMGWFTGQRYPVAERLARRGFYVPSGMALADEDISTVAERVREVLAPVPSAPSA